MKLNLLLIIRELLIKNCWEIKKLKRNTKEKKMTHVLCKTNAEKILFMKIQLFFLYWTLMLICIEHCALMLILYILIDDCLITNDCLFVIDITYFTRFEA